MSKSTFLTLAPFSTSLQNNRRPFCHDVESSGPTPLTDTLESTVAEIFFQIGVSGRLLDPSSTGRLTSAKLHSHPYFSIKRACASVGGVSLTYREDIEGRPRLQEVTLPLAQYETPAAVLLASSRPMERTRLPPHPPASSSSSSSDGNHGNMDVETTHETGDTTESQNTEDGAAMEETVAAGADEVIDWVVSVPSSVTDAKRIMMKYRDEARVGIILNLEDQVLRWSSEEQMQFLGAKRKRDTEIHTQPVPDNVFDVAPAFSDGEPNGRVWYVWMESSEMLEDTAIIIHIR